MSIDPIQSKFEGDRKRLCLLAGMLFCFVSVCLTPSAASPPLLSTVYDKERSPTEDVIYFRNNDVLRGKVLNETLELTTPYGDFKVVLRRCAGISFEGAGAITESLVLVNMNRITGVIKDRTIQFQIGSSSAEIPVRKEKVRFVLLKKTATELDFVKPDQKADLYIMSNGDLLTGKPADARIKIQTDYGEIPVSFSEIKDMEMQGGNNVTAIIKKTNGDTMRGTLVTEEITLNLDSGVVVQAVYKDKFSKIFVDDGLRQIAAHFGVVQPVRGESDGALTLGSVEGADIITNSIGMKLKLIKPGTFRMGAVDVAGPAHQVTLTKAFFLGVYEVTQAEYGEVTRTNPSKFIGRDLPVEQASWEEAQEFCKKLNESEKASGRLPAGHSYRLPTEAEWEYACRAGSKTQYSFGEDAKDLGEYAWFSGNSDDKTHPVGAKKPNAWGLYDMHGNVWEWCQDWYGDYMDGAATDPKGPTSGSLRVSRGGSWRYAPPICRSANRYGIDPAKRDNDGLGFRVALVPVP